MKNRFISAISNNSLLLLLIPFFAIQFVYSSQTINPDYSIRGILFFLYLTTILIIVILSKRQQPNIILINPIFIITIVLLLLMIFISRDAINISVAIKSIAGYSMFPVFLFVFVILISSFSKSIEKVSLLVSFYVLILSVISFYQIFKVFSLQNFDLINIYDIRSTLNHKNLFSHILLLSLPFTIFNAYKQIGKLKYFSLFVLFITLLQIVIILTRSTWITLIFILLSTFIVYLIFRKKLGIKIFSKSIISKLIPLIALVIICSYFVISTYDNYNSFNFRLKSLKNFRSQNIQKRIYLWENTFKMIDDNLISGVGSGNWKIHIPKYAKDGKHNNYGEIRYQTPHNDYLSIFAENGIFGMLLYISIFIFGIYYCIRIVLKAKNKDDKIFALLIFGGVIGYISISMFSAAKEYFETLFFLSIMLSFVIVKNADIQIKQKKQSKLLFILMSFFFIVTCILGVNYMVKAYKSEKHTKLAVKYIDDGNYKLCNQEVDKAYSKYISCDPTGTPLKWYSGNSNFALGKYFLAFSDYKEAYKLAPFNSFVLTNIASACALLEKYDKAEEFFNKSLEIKSENPDAINNLITIYLIQNKLNESLNLCLWHGYDEKSSKFHNLFITTLKQKVHYSNKYIEDKIVRNTILNKAEHNSWLLLTFKESIQQRVDFNELVKRKAIKQIRRERLISEKEEKNF